MAKVGIVVVTFNRKELLRECLKNLLSSSYPDFHIFLVDNGSTDGTKDALGGFLSDSKISYFNTGKNIGGAGGFNFGRKKAIEAGTDYLWLRDDDCRVQKDSLSSLVNEAEKLKDNFGFLSSKVLWKDGSPCRRNIQHKAGGLQVNLNGGVSEIKAATFVSFFTRREVAEEIGLPIKDFFIWGDDIEYSKRISKKYPSFYVPESVVVHKSAKNIGSNITKEDKDKLGRYFYAYRNEAFLYKKEGIKGRIYYFLKRCKHRAKVILQSKDAKLKRLSIIIHGTHQGRHFHPKVEYTFSDRHQTEVRIFFGEPLSYGGQEAFRRNRYSNFHNSSIHYTFVTPFQADNAKFIERIKARGDSLIHFDYPFNSRKRKREIVKSVKSVLREKKFDVVHIQTGSVYTLLEVSKIAKKAGVKKVIAHSHAGGFNNFKYRLIKSYSDKRIDKYADLYFACSQLAGEWKFPKKVLESERYQVIDNGIQTEKYCFNPGIRARIRAELGIQKDQLTFIHVGRFAKEKNHVFFYDLLPEIEKEYPDFRFIFVGAGETKKDFQRQRKTIGLSSHILYLEHISNVNEILRAADIFLFPSLYEGFPMTLVEAQASGLPTIFSDKITKECILTDYIYRLPLDCMVWMAEIKNIVPSLNIDKRLNAYKDIAEKGYDASKSAKILEDTYLGREGK